MRKEEYINEVISKIENKKARREVEKELSAHIDDRISYYTDAGWDEETANVKAMEHMGKAEDVADNMSRLHSSFIKRISPLTVAFILLFYIIFDSLFAFVKLTSIEPLIYDEWCTVLIRDYTILLFLLIPSTVVAYVKNGKLLRVALYSEALIVFLNILNIIVNVAYSISIGFLYFGNDIAANCVTIPVVSLLIVCTYYACGGEYKKTYLNKKAVRIVVCAVLCLVTVGTVYYFIGLSTTEAKIYSKGMPEEVADVSFSADNDGYYFSDYKECFFRQEVDENGNFGNFGCWCVEKGYFKPTKRLPEKYLDGDAGWILNDNPDYLFFVNGNNGRGVTGNVYIKDEVIDSYDFVESRLFKVMAGGVDLTDYLNNDEIGYIRQSLEATNMDWTTYGFNYYSSEQYDKSVYVDILSDEIQDALSDRENGKTKDVFKLKDVKSQYCISWYYKGLDGVYLEKGYIIETINGKLYFTLEAYENETFDLVAPNGLFEFTGDMKNRMQKAVSLMTEDENETEDILADLAKEMKESVNSQP